MTRKKMHALVVVGALVGSIVAAAPPASGAGPIDPERYSGTPTSWYWYTAASPATIADRLKSGNYRLIDLEVAGTNPLRFTAAMVRNRGTYARSWWWYYGQTAKSLKDKLAGRRLIDLEAYGSGSSKRYAAVMVANSGSKRKSWQWWLNATPAFVEQKVNAFRGRIVDIDRLPTGRYNIVLLKNTGSDAKSWWYYYAITAPEIGRYLDDNDARLVDIESEGNGRYTVVMVRQTSGYWWWHNELTASQAIALYRQVGMRIYDVERYTNAGGQTRYAVLLMNNLNTAGTRARQALWGATQGNFLGSNPVAFGYYLKKIDGSVLSALQHQKVFEPASMLKVLHLLTAMRKVKDTPLSVNSTVTWYAHPSFPARYRSDPGFYNNTSGGHDKDVCAYDANGTKRTENEYSDPLGNIVLRYMMEDSDNRATDAVWNRFGKGGINATADWVGMTKTELHHRIGCTWDAAGVTKEPNELTLRDAELLYEKVWRKKNPILGTGQHRDDFYDYMATGLGAINVVVDQEAPTGTIANQFKDAMRGAFKAGGYGNGAGECDNVGCTAAIFRNTGGGYVALPFKVSTRVGKVIQRRGYVYGAFIDGYFDCGPGGDQDCSDEGAPLGAAKNKALQEMLRPEIKKALATWS